MYFWIALASAIAGQPDQIRDVGGRLLDPFKPGGAANVLVFVTSDCPVSNAYAPEIYRLCTTYRSRGVACTLLYEDWTIDPAAVRRHLDEYRYSAIPAVIDRDQVIARRANASVTPQVVVLDAAGTTRYRGRIDNRYADIGKQRRIVTVHDLRDALEAVLAGKPVQNPETPAVGCFISGR